VVGKTVPVVILTGDDSTISQDITKVQGATNYLIKYRTSAVELRRALYEAVVPDVAPNAPLSSNGESMIAKAASRFLTKIRLK
jgi:hypothetical protein